MGATALNITNRNSELPFFPSENWYLTEESKGNLLLPTFSWLQAFFDAENITVAPQLAVWSGQYHANGDPVLSVVRFAYSGERVNFKGKAVFAAGTNILNQVVTSAVIGETATTDLLQVIAWGGAY